MHDTPYCLINQGGIIRPEQPIGGWASELGCGGGGDIWLAVPEYYAGLGSLSQAVASTL
jgi:hypothetical protein